MKKLGILGAMPEEVAGILAAIERTGSTTLGDREFVEGRWHGLDVVVAFSRWGKVAAAATASVMIARFGIEGLLFVGVAGAMDPALNLGDVVVASELLQHDMDVSVIPVFQRFEIPLLGKVRFAAHPPWATAARTATEAFLSADFITAVPAEIRADFGIAAPKVVAGLIASGDRFVGDPAESAALRAALPDLACVEMEGAAIAQVAFEFGLPCAVVRVISDKADHDAPVDFQRFVGEVASVMTAAVASRVVQAIASEAGAAQFS